MNMKTMTLRMPEDEAAALAAVAQADGISVAAAVRQAINAHIEARRRDRAFQTRLKASMKRNQAILEKLAQL